MLTAIQRPQAPSSVSFTSSAVPAIQAIPAQVSELRPSDSVQRTAAVGSIPASVGLFAYPAESLDKALKTLSESPSEETARKAQAGFRVAIRAHDLNTLNQLQAAIQSQIHASSDFRTQRLLAEIQVDLYMEIHAKGGKPNIPALTAPALPGNTPESVVQGSLKKLNSHLSEANYREARAGFRVALRNLSVADLAKTEQLVKTAVQTTADYRQQLFLDDLLEDLLMEQFNRGLKPEAPALQMPPALGKAPAEIAANALKLLNQSASEANYRTAVAAVRVAARDLSKEQKAALKAEFQAAMKQTSDYRTQVYLDLVSRELY